MLEIRTKDDLKLAYEHISFINSFMEQVADTKRAKEMIAETKKAIRQYNKKETNRRLVKDYGIDGFIELVELPDVEDPIRWFEENEWISNNPCAWDCTGRPFTAWCKFFKRRNKNICYHRVCYDV